MGLLDNILSAVDNRKRVLKRNLFDFFDDPNGTAQVWADRASDDRYGGAEERQAVVNQIKGKPYDKQALARADQKQQQSALDQAMGAITVWHGSPHKFDKFDMSKIGTGEGAQAYGHGLYMAEAPETAMSYRASVSRGQEKAFGLDDGPTKGIATLIAARGKEGEEMARKAYANLGKDLEPTIQAAKQAVDGNSQLYKVDIPDEAVARFLDWDKPLSEEMRQPISKALMDKFGSGVSMGNGEQAYKQIIDEFKYAGSKDPKNEAIAWMNQNGIPGIRYLDGGSRGQQAGTSNFVLFDDQMPRILEINGQPTGLLPWGKGEWKGLLE